MRFLNLKYYSVLLIIISFFVSASCKTFNNNDGMIFYDYFDNRIWINGNEANIEKMKGNENRTPIQFFFDPVSKKTWAWNSQKDNKYLFIADITSGNYLQEKEITLINPLINPEKKQPMRVYAYNEKIMISYSLLDGGFGEYGELFVSFDLQTGKQEIIDFLDIYNKLGILTFFVGWDGKSIILNKGYYNILERKFYKFDMELGINQKNNMIVDYFNGNYRKIEIKRNKFNLKDACDVYIDNEDIYIGIATFWSNFNFLPGRLQRKWFKYDIYTEKKTRVNAPSITSEILACNVNK